MDGHTQERRNYGFVIGLMTGTLVGAGLAMWLVPRAAAEIRKRMTGSAKSFGKRAAEQYQQASARAGEVVEEITQKGQGVRDGVAAAVAHGAHEVERFALAAKSDRR
jgi:gas vesicle protein